MYYRNHFRNIPYILILSFSKVNICDKIGKKLIIDETITLYSHKKKENVVYKLKSIICSMFNNCRSFTYSKRNDQWYLFGNNEFIKKENFNINDPFITSQITTLFYEAIKDTEVW